jgi:hypothetical protein
VVPRRHGQPRCRESQPRCVVVEAATSSAWPPPPARRPPILTKDPTFRAAALAHGRDYRDVDSTQSTPCRPDRRTLSCFADPAPAITHGSAPPARCSPRYTSSSRPWGHVAVLLDSSSALAYGITWTGTFLAAATGAGLPVLRDVVCVHDMEADRAGQSEAPASVTLRHRVIPRLSRSDCCVSDDGWSCPSPERSTAAASASLLSGAWSSSWVGPGLRTLRVTCVADGSCPLKSSVVNRGSQGLRPAPAW